MRFAAAIALFALALAAQAHQVRFITISVPPYYEMGPSRLNRPQVAIGSPYDARLASRKREDVAFVRDAVRAEPATVNPITLMVLAIRLYDVGLRDDAVFWFHAARGRVATAEAVLDLGTVELDRQLQGARNLALRAGHAINGYAYCDLGRQRELRRAALDWVERNPYAPVFMESFKAKPGDRTANLRRALESLRAEAKEEEDALAVPANAARLAAVRKAEDSDEMYCWR